MASNAVIEQPGRLWENYRLALDRVTERMERITAALDAAAVPYALVGGQAVALWVATRDPAAVRTTKDVDVLVQRADLPKLRAAIRTSDFDYFETLGVGMLLDRHDPNPRHAVHLVWAGEKVRASEPHPSPPLGTPLQLDGRWRVVSIRDLVLMKLLANRDQDRVHLRDMIGVDLVDRSLLAELPSDLHPQLNELLTELGR